MSYIIGINAKTETVGWAVVKDDYQVVEAGVNVFPSGDANKNIERRNMRQSRRGKRREDIRKKDFEKLWKKYNLITNSEPVVSILELRIKALHEEIALDELYAILKNNLKHRGITYLDDAMEDGIAGSSDYSKGLELNMKELETKLPCEIQYERLKEYGKYRGKTKLTKNEEESVVLSNVFSKSAYRTEIERIFETQMKYHPELTSDLQEAYLKIFDRKRKYYEGPGNEKSRTDYGRYTTKWDPETSDYITEENIFEKLIGKCTVYPKERRASGASYTAQEFNLLNDLNNLTVNNRKLEKEEKFSIIHQVKNSNRINMRKIIQNAIGEKIDMFSGARIDEKGKEIFHSFEAYNKIRKELEERNLEISRFSREELDIIGDILTLNTDREAILDAFTRNGIVCDDEYKECLINIRKKNGSIFNKWHAFSFKIMLELMPELYEQPKNQMQLLTDIGFFANKEERLKEYAYIPNTIITEELYNPTIKRSVKVSIDIINAIIKKYGYPEQVVIEMPRDTSAEEENKRQQELKRKNEKEWKEIKERIKEEYGDKFTEKELQLAGMSLKLWHEQDGKCLYSGKTILLEDLLHDPDKFEVDNIIPLAISLDNSRSNKALVYQNEFQNKGIRTPYMYLSDYNKEREWTIKEYENFVTDLKNRKKISTKKAEYLLFSEDIKKIETLNKFVQQNLNDNKYISRVILSSLKGYFKGKNTGTKVNIVQAGFAQQMRRSLKLDKNRTKTFSHRAVDAMLICFSKMGYDAYRKFQNSFIDFETGEILDEVAWKKQMGDDIYREYLYQNKWFQIRNTIMIEEKKVKFWYKVDRACNRSLCNQTIYGTRCIDEKIVQIRKLNLYTDGGIKKFKNIIANGKQEKFLMYKHDPKTFEHLMMVFEQYKDEKNPFEAYEKETGDFVRKYTKKHNGPRVVTMRYTDGEVNSCIDVSHKYGHEKGSRKVILESLNPYRMDVYFNKNNQEYYFVGLKYSDIKCQGNHYVIDEDAYNNVLIKEKMIELGQTRLDLKKLGYEFKMSFYKNDIIEYEKDGIISQERFGARTLSTRNYIATKPINAPKYEKPKLVGLSKTKHIKKISADILGNWYYVSNEGFKAIVDKIH